MMNSMTYKFASYNCKNVKSAVNDVQRLCDECVLIALQETWLLPEELAYINSIDSRFGAYGTSAVDTTAGLLRGRPHGGTALMWNTSVFPSVTVIDCDNPRVCAIRVSTATGPLIVVCIYMPTNKAENLPMFTDCMGTVSAISNDYINEPIFVLGDFNAHPGELFFKELNIFCHECNWEIIDVNMLGLTSKTFTYIDQACGSKRWLDHYVVSQSAAVSVCRVYVTYDVLWSDHFPVICECKLERLTPLRTMSSVTDNRVKWGEKTADDIAQYRVECHKRLRLIDFPTEFRMCSDLYCNDPTHNSVIDKIYSDIVLALSQASMEGRGGKRVQNKRPLRSVAGWSKIVSDSHGAARASFQEWLLCGSPSTGVMYTKMCKTRKIFKSRLKWCQKHQNQLKMDVLAEKHSAKDFKGFWKSTNHLRIRPGLPVSVDGTNNLKDIADKFKDSFIVGSPLGPSSSLRGGGVSGKNVDTIVSAKDVSMAVKSISHGKSPGHDGLSVEHIQHAGPHMCRVLAMFYNFCISHSYLPPDMMRTVVVPVVKNKAGDLSDISNYRPISLATIVAKVFDSILNTQLNKYIKLHDNQFGFRPGLSTESAILCLKSAVKYYTERKTSVYACFLDLSKAFDLVSYDILWNKMRSSQIPCELITIFKYWYMNQVNHVKWAGTLSDPYRLECGVRQGGLSSPSIFNLYMNGLIEALSEQHIGCHIDGVCFNNISYADDMVLLSASVCGLRRLMTICENYAADHGLRYNVKKSQCMVFQGGARKVIEMPPIKLNGSPLERVEIFKYLGHFVTPTLKDDADIERERRALSVRANMIIRRFARCSKDVKLTLFRAYCTTMYTCSLWTDYTQKSYNALRVQFNNAFRMLLALPRYCSASTMFAEARVDCFHATMRKRGASLVRRVRGGANTMLAALSERLDCAIMTHCCQRHVAG